MRRPGTISFFSLSDGFSHRTEFAGLNIIRDFPSTQAALARPLQNGRDGRRKIRSLFQWNRTRQWLP